MKISVSSYSFQQYINQGKLTQADLPAKAKEMGFDAVEFIDLKPCENPTYEQQTEYARLIRANADKAGIKINAYTIGANLNKETEEERKAEVERIKAQLDIAHILGADTLRHDICWGLNKTARSFDLLLPVVVDSIREISDYAQTLGIKTCTENHGYISQDSDRVERLFNAVNHENFGLLVDMGNFVCVDEDSVTAVSRVAPYAVHAHAKDMHVYSGSSHTPGAGAAMTRGGNWFRGAIIGQGSVKVKQCLRVLKRAGYDGYVSIEFEGVEDCIHGISTGLANLRRYISELENE